MLPLIIGFFTFLNGIDEYIELNSISATLFIGPGVLLITAILGAFIIIKINQEPSRYGGKGFAIVSMILGIIGTIIGVIILSDLAF